MDALGAIRELKLDILESLSIRLHHVFDPKLITTFETAPSLKAVELRGASGGMRIALPFSQLQSYIDDGGHEMRGVSSARYFLDILKKSPQLLKFHAGGDSVLHEFLTANPVVAPPLLHESLEELSLYDPMLLRSIVLPALRIMTLGHPYRAYKIPLLALSEMIARSSCSLTSLSLRNIAFDDQGTSHWRDILDLTPCLTKLEVIMLHSYGNTSTFLSSLIEGLDEKGDSSDDLVRYDIVPLLTDLAIKVADEADEEGVYHNFLNSDFVDMVAWRYRWAALRNVCVVVRGEDKGRDFWEFRSNEFEFLNGLKSEGLRICVFKERDGRGKRVDCLATEVA